MVKLPRRPLVSTRSVVALLLCALVGRADNESPGGGGHSAGQSSRAPFPDAGNGTKQDPCKTSDCTDPVDLATGEFSMTRTDLDLPGLLEPLSMSFQYRSQRVHNGRYGFGWYFPLEMRLFVLQGGDILWRLGSGEQQRFIAQGGGDLVPVGFDEFHVGLVPLFGSGWRLTTADRNEFEFGPEGLLEQWTDPRGNVTTFSWESDGFGTLLKFPIVGRIGEIVALDYRLESITSTLGKQVHFDYYGAPDGNKNGRLKYLSDDYGRIVEYDYDQAGNLIEVLSPSTTYQDETGASVTRPRTTNYTYTVGNRDPRPGSPESRHDHNLLTITDDRVETQLVNHYDDFDRVYRQEYGGGTTDIAYVGTGGIVTSATITDPNGFVHRYTFNSKGQPTENRTTAVSSIHGLTGFYTTTYAYDAANQAEVERIRLPLSNGVRLDYDSEGNLVERRRMQDPNLTPSSADLVWNATYESVFNQPKTITDELGYTTTYFYDYEEASLGDLNGDGITTQSAGNLVRIRYPDATRPDGTTQTPIIDKYQYNSSGQLTRAIDAEGREVEWQYYGSGHASFGLVHKRIVDPAGLALTTEYAYDSYGFLSNVTNPRGHVTSYVHNSVGELLELQGPLGAHVKFTYDANGNVVKTETRNLDESGTPRDPEWIRRIDAYDTWNRLVSSQEDVAKNGGGLSTRKTTFEYDALGNVTLVTSPEGRKTKLEYDERGMQFRATRGFGSATPSVSRVEVDRNGRIVEAIDGNLDVTLYAHDSFDRVTSITDPEGDLVQMDWSKRDEVVERRVVDPTLGLMSKTQIDLDQLGRPIRGRIVDVGNASNYSESWREYDKSSRVVKSRTPRGHFTELDYDTAGRLISTTDPIGNAIALTLDDNGNPTQVESTEKVPGGSDEVYESTAVYDALDRPTSVTRIDRLAPSHQVTTSFEYDSRHNLVEVTDPVGRVMRTAHDLLSRPTLGIEDALGLAITNALSYDDDGLLSNLLDPDGHETTWTHDALGRVARIDYETGLYEAFTYDAADNVLTHRTQDGVVTTLVYHDDRQLESRTAGTRSEEFAWNALGAPDVATTRVSGVAQNSVVFAYDGFGRVLSESIDSSTVVAGYDDGHNLTSLLYPDATEITQEFDALDRLIEVHVDAGQVAQYTWFGHDRVRTRDTGGMETYTWDGLKRLTRIDAGSVQDVSYGYDDLGRRTWVQRSHQSGVGDVYAYDSGSRLDEVWYDATNPPGGTSGFADHLEVGLSDAGDRTSTTFNSAPTTYNSSDPLHRYTQIGSTTRAYDAKGNLTDDGTYVFAYDPWNRLLSSAPKSTGIPEIAYELDAFGRRIAAAEGSTSKTYSYFGARLLAEQRTGDTDRLYVYGAGLDETVALLYDDERYEAHQDALGSLTALVRNSDGSVRERFEYDAFGQPAAFDSGGSPMTNSWGRPTSDLGHELWFAGARWDGFTGHYHMRARQYEPAAGRFVSRDPLGYVDGPNQYEYAHSSPVNWVDPWGLEAQSGPRHGRTPFPNGVPEGFRPYGERGLLGDLGDWLANSPSSPLEGLARIYDAGDQGLGAAASHLGLDYRVTPYSYGAHAAAQGISSGRSTLALSRDAFLTGLAPSFNLGGTAGAVYGGGGLAIRGSLAVAAWGLPALARAMVALAPLGAAMRDRAAPYLNRAADAWHRAQWEVHRRLGALGDRLAAPLQRIFERRCPPRPLTSAETSGLRDLFGKSTQGAEQLLGRLRAGQNVPLPPGVTPDTLSNYRAIAEQAIAAGKDTLGVQAMRRAAIDILQRQLLR
jgi:RHS repeat-associated protein